MASRRYLPVTLPVLARALRTGSVPVPPGVVVATDGSEDAEYEALLAAGDAAAALLGGLPDGQRRRAVVVTEVEEDPVPLARVVALHVDSADDADPDDDLGWYATQELGDLVAGVEVD